MGETQPAATPSASQELEALELARGRLETVLANDENWRALSQAGAEDVDRAGRAARQARNTRLEMALAGNAHYQAWKHLNGAITALRARNASQAPQLEDSAPPLPTEPTGTRGPAHGQTVSTSSPSPQRLAERLGQLEGGQIEAIALPGERGRVGAVAGKGRRDPLVRRDAPEASVTFVVREAQAPSTQAGAAPPKSMAQESDARLERVHSLEAREVAGRSQAAGGTDAEAEVTIISAEGRRQQREAEAKAGHVRRFRRALSGD